MHDFTLHPVSPALQDGGHVGAGADVGHDEGVLLAGHAERRVVGLTHRQEVGRRVARHQLQHVGDQRRGTQAERQDPWGEERGGSGGHDPWGEELEVMTPGERSRWVRRS